MFAFEFNQMQSCCVYLLLIIIQYNHHIDDLLWRTDKHIPLLGQLLKVSEMEF